ncbi:CPBP family intramembrane glutamic endopeptidase [Fodinibius sediminis]|uniref:CAAX protease self-immunity n=1 Tax=Fodinibius sediminis TaxID=1214077 RepID=A0A521AS66_9BACT|nr:CPBP family intramembrane glutamic endopeptidase [Fodinibius sediminis]SMO37480.1 CAAX protease self-immunity [Fodinibius sediminis]
MSRTHAVLLAEGMLLFLGIPLLYYREIVPLPKIPALLLIAVYCGFQLWRDPNFDARLFAIRNSRNAGSKIFNRLPVVLVALFLLIRLFKPNYLFVFPVEQPVEWMVVMMLYPLFSALPQELIYRTYFFYRYRPLMSGKYAAVITSALLFSFLHIVYDNWWAVGLSFVAGILFGITYLRTQSLFWVSVEHVLYGWLVFTLGFGPFFYEPL